MTTSSDSDQYQVLEEDSLSTIRKLAAEVVQDTAFARVGALRGEFLETPLTSLFDEQEQGIVLRSSKDTRLFLYHIHPDAHVHHVGEHHITFDRVRLKRVPMPPPGYAYTGGAARLALQELLERPVENHTARDLDLVRIGNEETERDKAISEKFMPDDFQHGYGVELSPSLCRYLNTRDITMNETLYFADRIVASRAAIQDTYNGYIRPTMHVVRADGMIPGNIVCKMLRFQAEATLEGRKVRVVGIPADQTVAPFDIALHLDRALGRSSRLAKKYLSNCVEYGFLCAKKSCRGDIAETMNLLRKLSGSSLKQFPSFAASQRKSNRKVGLPRNGHGSYRKKKRA